MRSKWIPRLNIRNRLKRSENWRWSIRSPVRSLRRIIRIFLIIKSSGQVWMKSCIWHFRFWTMHCYLHRVHRWKKRFWMPASEKISWVLMTMESISRSFLLSLKMRIVTRKRHLSVWSKRHSSRLWKTEWIKNLWRQGSTITSSASERQILEIIRRGWCTVFRSWTAGCMMRTNHLCICRLSRRLNF